MLALAFNCGSSTLKCALIDTASGNRVRTTQSDFREAGDERGEVDASEIVAQALEGLGLSPGDTPDLVVHRIVHGGERFTGPVRIDDRSIAGLAELEHLAPLHNRLALKVIAHTRAMLSALPQVAVFDTSFHSTLPAVARTYALPAVLFERYGIRRFGFHGLSHANVQRVAGREHGTERGSPRVVSCHLGNGASLAAIKDGVSIDTSMGMTPLEGLIMGTRAGDLDPGVLLELMRIPGMDADALSELLYRNAGLKALTGTQDMREIERRAIAGEETCRLAIAVYAYRVRKYIGAYAAAMGGIDMLAFTGGVGENSAHIRSQCAGGLEFLGIVLDPKRNVGLRIPTDESMLEISLSGSRVRVLVIRADEEREMASAAASLIHSEAAVR